MLPTPKKIELLLNGAQPMVRVEWILRPGENGRLGAEEVGEIIPVSSTTFTTRCEMHSDGPQEDGLLLAVALNLHEYFRHCRWWRQIVAPSIGSLGNVLTSTGTSHHPVAKQWLAMRRQVLTRT